MSNDGTNWHSDDELASALERALEIPDDSSADAGAAYAQQDAPAGVSPNEFGDLFSTLVEPNAAAKSTESTEPPVVAESTESAAVDSTASEQVFESLDDFRPRTNFVPVVVSEMAEDAPIDEAVEASAPAVSELPEVSASPVTLSSAQVTQPVRYDRQRPTFDEIVFGVTSVAENK